MQILPFYLQSALVLYIQNCRDKNCPFHCEIFLICIRGIIFVKKSFLEHPIDNFSGVHPCNANLSLLEFIPNRESIVPCIHCIPITNLTIIPKFPQNLLDILSNHSFNTIFQGSLFSFSDSKSRKYKL